MPRLSRRANRLLGQFSYNDTTIGLIRSLELAPHFAQQIYSIYLHIGQYVAPTHLNRNQASSSAHVRFSEIRPNIPGTDARALRSSYVAVPAYSLPTPPWPKGTASPKRVRDRFPPGGANSFFFCAISSVPPYCDLGPQARPQFSSRVR